jgi:hypothetical protein
LFFAIDDEIEESLQLRWIGRYSKND